MYPGFGSMIHGICQVVDNPGVQRVSVSELHVAGAPPLGRTTTAPRARGIPPTTVRWHDCGGLVFAGCGMRSGFQDSLKKSPNTGWVPSPPRRFDTSPILSVKTLQNKIPRRGSRSEADLEDAPAGAERRLFYSQSLWK